MNSIFKFLAVLALIGVVHAQCTASQIEVTIEKNNLNWCYEESIHIYEGYDVTSGTAVWEKTWTNDQCYAVYTYTACLNPFTPYTLYMADTWGDGWTNGAYVTVKSGETVIVNQAKGTGRNSYVNFIISTLISSSTPIKYTNVAQTGNTWTQPTFPDTTWTAYTAGFFPSVAAITRYYRVTATFPPNPQIYAIVIEAKIKSGYALYVNGIEAYRWNLIAGATATTPASGTSTSYLTRKIVLSAGTYTATGSITFALELHNMSVDAETDEFELKVDFLSGNPDSVSVFHLPGAPTCDPATGPSTAQGEVCANLFDNNDDTKYYYETAGTSSHYIIYDGAIQMNGYQIISGNDAPDRDPKNFKVYGTKDSGTTWFVIDAVGSNAFTSRKTPYNFIMPSQSAVLNGLKIEITSNNGAIGSNTGNPGYQFQEIRPIMVNTPLLPAGIHYENTVYTMYTGVPVNIAPTSNGVYNIRINPPLPDGLFLDDNTGRIYGSPNVAGPNTYTITATVGATAQDVTTQLTLTIIGCVQPSYANLKIEKVNQSQANDERFNVYTEANVSILESNGYNYGGRQTYEMCASAGKLKFVLFDDGNNGWDAGAYLDVSIKYDGAYHRISRLYLIDGTTATYYVNVKLDIVPQATGWKYRDNAVIDPTWYTTSYNDAAWTPLTFAPYPNSITKIQLFRKTVTGITRANYKGVELTFKSKAGVVIYANGAEVYRANLPAGDITAATTAIGGDSTAIWRKVTFPISVLGTGGNSLTLAIGLVELVAAPYALDFDATHRFLPASDVIQVYTGSQVADSTWGEMDMFDCNIGTRWISEIHDSQTEHYVQVVFDANNALYANKYCIVSNYDAPRHDPVDWKIYGTNDGITWDLLATETNVSWEGRRQRQCFYIPTLDKAKRGYRFAPTKARVVEAANRYAASEMELYIEDIDGLVIPPLAMTPTNLVAYKDVPVPALISSSEYWRNFSIQPALPSPLSMDSSNGYINGNPTALLSPTPYTITATDIKGNTLTTTITFSVVICNTPNSILTLEIVFEGGSPVEASWEIKTPSNTVLDSRTASVAWATETFTYCTAAGLYTFTFGDTANDGWNTGSYYIKDRIGQTLASGTVEYGYSPKTVQVTIGGLIEPGTSTWKYLLDGSQPASNWYTSAFSDAAWQSGFGGSIPAPTSSSTTQYYRTTFTIAVIDSVNNAAFEIAAKSYAGIAIYINDNEVFRANLPSGTLSQSTTATTSLSDYQFFYFSVPITSNVIVAGQNLFAVEVHKKDTIPTTNGFDGLVNYVTNNSYRVMDGVSWSDIEKYGFEGTDSVFDNNIATKVYISDNIRCVGAIYQWTYNNGRREYVNQYKVTNALDCNHRHPSGWTIEGSNDNGATWTILHGAHNQYFTSYQQTFSYDFYSAVPYNSYRFTATECNNEAIDWYTPAVCGAGKFQLAEIAYYVTNTPAACAADGAWGPAPEGGYSFQNCGVGYKGYKRRPCTGGVLGSEQNLCIVDPPTSFSYPQSSYTFHKTIPANAAPVCVGVDLTYTITPSLPSNLQFSTSNGVISGTPTANANLASYNVTCGNSAGTLSFVLQISVDTLSCSADSGWPMTEVNQQATQNCPSTDYEGQKTRSCTYNGSSASWGPAVDNCVLRIPTIRYDNTAYTFYKGDAIPSLVPITQYQVTSYSINPQLPSGLSFSTSNGQIYGTPVVAVSGQTYTIQATNSRGSGSTTITISVLTVTCASDGTWPQTERGLTAYVACPDGQTGMQSRLCKAVGTGAASGVWELADSASCFIYTPGENPGDGKLFVNLPLQIQGISASAFKTPSTYEIFRKSIANQLSTKHSISSSSVQITDINDATTAAALYAVATDVNVRVLTPEAQKEAVTNTLSTYVKATDSTGLLATLQSSTDPNLRQVTGTSMKGNISYTTNALSGGIIALIVILVVLVVLIVAVVAFCLFTRMKGKNSKNGKKLGASKKIHKDAKADSKNTKTSGKAVKV